MSASWIFQPVDNADGFTINSSLSGWKAGYLILYDITEDSEIFNEAYFGINSLRGYVQGELSEIWDGPDSTGFSLGFSPELYLNNLFVNNHTYSLKLGALAESGVDAWTASLSTDLQATSVPEPSDMILLGASLLLLLAFQRKKVFK